MKVNGLNHLVAARTKAVVLGLVSQHAATKQRSEDPRMPPMSVLCTTMFVFVYEQNDNVCLYMTMFVLMYDNVCLQHDNVCLVYDNVAAPHLPTPYVSPHLLTPYV